MADANMGVVIDIAQKYGAFQKDVVAKQNDELVKTAQMNYDVAEQQTLAQAAEMSQSLSLEYQKTRGAAQAMAAYRGVASPDAALSSDGFQAVRARRNIEINAANEIASLAAASQVQFQNTNLSQIQGTMAGLDLGTAVAAAQTDMPWKTTYEDKKFWNGYEDVWYETSSSKQDDLDLASLLDNPAWEIP